MDVWELEYKIVEPFGRGHWTICDTKESAKFQLGNLAYSMPNQKLHVRVYEEGDSQRSHKDTAANVYHQIFTEE